MASAAHRFDMPVAGGTAHVRFSDRAAGSFSSRPPEPVTENQRQRFVPLPWSWLHQVHGASVRSVRAPADQAGMEGDALVSATWGCALAVQVADCVPIALVGEGATVAVVHAGWRGLAAGVVPAAVTASRSAGSGHLRAVVGPHIGPECYEFGIELLGELEELFGPEVRGLTSGGTPALDLGAAVRASLTSSGVDEVETVDRCTACDEDHYFSHRARGESGRHALVAWLDREDAG